MIESEREEFARTAYCPPFASEWWGTPAVREEIICALPDRRAIKELGFCFPEDPEYWEKYRTESVEGNIVELELAENPFVGLRTPTLVRDLLNWPPVKRMGDWGGRKGRFLDDLHGFGQLGLSREVGAYLGVPPTRGWHELVVAYSAASACARLARKQKEEFFEATSKYREPRTSDDEHISQMLRVVTVFGFLHDLHPPGGDGVKIATGLDEREILGHVMRDKKLFAGFCSICESHGLPAPEKIRDWAVEMVGRKEEGLLGQLVHGPSKEVADIDFIMYVLGDTTLGLIGILASYYDEASRKRDSLTPEIFLERLSSRLQFPQYFDPHHRELFDFWSFNPIPDLFLIEGKLAFSCPKRLVNLIRLSSVLYQFRYYTPDMLGPELALKKEFDENPELYPSRQELVSITLPKLKEKLRGTPAEEIFSAEYHRGWRRKELTSKEEANEFEQKGWLVGQFPINLRLGTPVRDVNGGIMTAREWADKHQDGLGSKLKKIEKRYQRNYIAFKRI